MDLPPVPCFASATALGGGRVCETHVATGEVTTLKHELGDDTVELGARVAEALLASAESTEVLSRLGDDVVEELEVDAALLVWRARSAIGFDGHGLDEANGHRSDGDALCHVEEGQLTLLGALGGHIAVGVDLDLRAVPGDIEVSLDDHVGC